MPAGSVRLTLPGADQSVSAVWTSPVRNRDIAFVYAPGASAGITDGFGMRTAMALAEQGIATLRFQFPYREASRAAPDRPPVLEATWRAALIEARRQAGRVIAGGRSMGGRIASQVAAQGEEFAALALFASPLHPPGRPEQRRDAHLGAIECPVLFCSGDRDTYATVDELREVAAGMKDARLHVLAGADHGFNVLKSSGRNREAVWQEAKSALLTLIEGVEK